MNDRFMKIYSKFLIRKSKFNFIELMESIINKLESNNNKMFIRNQKYTHIDYIMGIIEVLSNNTSWRKYNGLIDGRVLNNKHNYYSKLGVYDELYKVNLISYLKTVNVSKTLSIYSTFIENKNGHECLGRNIYYKNKKGRKITAIVEDHGIPLIIDISEGNHHDCKLFEKNPSVLSGRKNS